MYIGRVRILARACCNAWLEQRKKLGYPLVKDPALRKELGLDEEVAE